MTYFSLSPSLFLPPSPFFVVAPCTESAPNLDIQGTTLNPGEEVTYGLLEVCIGGSFLQVCSEIAPDLATADIICGALGYES